MSLTHEAYMQRCIDLARRGAGYVASNPMVGAVLVYDGRIIGEGYHTMYGEAHAEVNCLASVSEEDRQHISSSRMYVSLEPCAHYGKTPPCADLIIAHHIPEVIIGCRDSYREVDGKGIARLQAAGVNVVYGVMEKECRQLNRRFFCFQEQHRPYVILKWAQTNDGKIAGGTQERLLISNEYTNRLVHRWRSEEVAILVGTNTALLDNPSLTTRLWPGPSPRRMVVDMDLRLPADLHLMDGAADTIVFNRHRHGVSSSSSLMYYQLTEDVSFVPQFLYALYQLKILSVLVEGGARLLQSFIDENAWDEARVITNTVLVAGNGLPAPQLSSAFAKDQYRLGVDEVIIYEPSANR